MLDLIKQVAPRCLSHVFDLGFAWLPPLLLLQSLTPSPGLPAFFLPVLLSHLHLPLWHIQASFLFSGLSVSSH